MFNQKKDRKMLSLEIVKQADAIEKIVCEKIESLERQRLSDESSELLISLIFTKSLKDAEIPEKEKPFLVNVIEKRVKFCFTFKITDFRVTLFLASECKSPGNAVMMLWYLQYWCFKHNIKEVDLDMFCKDIFPMGLFKEDDLHKIWDQQKVMTKNMGGSGNLLDYSSAGLSIQFN